MPIYSLEATAEQLFAEDVSWLNARDEPESRWEEGVCFSAVEKTLVPRKVRKVYIKSKLSIVMFLLFCR